MHEDIQHLSITHMCIQHSSITHMYIQYSSITHMYIQHLSIAQMYIQHDTQLPLSIRIRKYVPHPMMYLEIEEVFWGPETQRPS